MARKSQPKRDTFRHGNLPEALVDAALLRLEAEGVESISLRDLARDAGVNHRAVYRHFPDKLSLLAAVAESGWRRLAQRLRKSTAGKAPGEPALIAGAIGFFQFARDCPNLEAAMLDALQIFAVGFAGTGMAPNIVVERTAVFVAALQGVITQILHQRLQVAPAKARAFVADVCR